MNVESRPAEQVDGQENEDAQPEGAQLNGAANKRIGEAAPGVPAAESTGKIRLSYLDPRGSESTRGLRDTARRRRDAEEKLQQHLLEAKNHVPNEHHGRAANHSWPPNQS